MATSIRRSNFIPNKFETSTNSQRSELGVSFYISTISISILTVTAAGIVYLFVN